MLIIVTKGPCLLPCWLEKEGLTSRSVGRALVFVFFGSHSADTEALPHHATYGDAALEVRTVCTNSTHLARTNENLTRLILATSI